MSSVDERAIALGFDSLSDYVASRPRLSLHALVHELAAPEINSIDAFVGLLLDRARKERALAACARDLLVRALHQQLDGWPRVTDAEGRKLVGSCLMGWATTIGARLPEYRRSAIDTALALLDDPVPVGWMPADANDSLLRAVFDHHWS